MNAVLMALGLSLAVNALFFALAAAKRTDAVTDLSYGLSFALTALGLLLVGSVRDPLGIAAGLMVMLWALRLAGYLFRRILLVKVDHRFDGRREHLGKFARFWLLQALSTALIMLPAIAAISLPAPPPSPLHAIGLAIWAFGLVIETIADAQKWSWKTGGGAGLVMRGLWSWSRHPNYFGEILVWWGLWVYALPVLSGAWHLAILGPLYITALLLFVTGIPLLERSAEERYGKEAAYREYKARTSLLIPLPPRPAGRAPRSNRSS